VTADDVVFSLGVPLEYPELNPIAVQYTSVEKVDDKTVNVTWPEPAYARLVDLFYPTMIVPVALYGGEDPRTFIDKEPNGSGPAVVNTFSPQQVTFDLRDDYWGGTFPMKQMRWVVSSSTSGQGLISNGTLDATCCIANYNQFVESDPDNHLLYLQPDGSQSAIIFNMAAAPFDDVNLRQAIASAVAIDQVRKLGEAKSPRTFPPSSISGLAPDVFGAVIPDEYLDRPDGGDPDAATAALEAGGYTVEDGKLIKDGQQVELELLINTADSNFGDSKSLGALLVQQFEQNLGVKVTLTPLPEDLFSERTKKGDFGMYASSITFGSGRGLFWSYRTLTSDYFVPLGEEASANNGRFNDPVFDQLVADLANTGDAAEQDRLALEVQQRFVEQVPAVPLISGGGLLVLSGDNWVGWPTDDDLDHVPSIGNGQDFILTMMDLKPAK
jgi:peptide/nickel transport system substrate-binding protein